MRSISHKVKTYRRQFRPIPSYVFNSRIFCLTFTLATVLTAAIALSVIASVVYGSTIYSHIPWVVLSVELALICGFVQLIVEANKRRYLRSNPGAAEPKLRRALMATEKERVATIIELFGEQRDFEVLARSLIDKWEWHQSIDAKSGDPVVKKARAFFGIPAASNFASYLGGLLAVVAAIVVTLLDKQTFYAQLPTLFSDIGEISWLITKHLVFPFAVVVIPLASLIGSARSVAERLIEKANDDYLSQASFFSFIKELLELQERKERRILMVTTGVAYWAFRLGTAPMPELPMLYRNMKRSRRLGSIRRGRLAGVARLGADAN